MSGRSSVDTAQPVGRLAAKLSHFENVRRVETDDDGERAEVHVVNSGVGPKVIDIIREFGYQISAINIRYSYVSVYKEGSA